MALRRMGKRRKGISGAPLRFFAVTAAVLTLPVLLRFFSQHLDLLGRVGQNAAILSAAANMPDSGIALLQERFREQLYNPPQEHQPQSVPQPQQEHSEAEPVPPEEEDDDGEAEPSAPEPTAKQPRIPAKYAAPIISENFAGGEGTNLVSFGAGYIKNETVHENETVEEILETPMAMLLESSDEPQVLIVHTHATESYEKYDGTVYDTRNTWRSTDNHNNMVAVGDAMQQVLEENGIGVLHDTTQHDYPSYNGSYERAAVTIAEYLEEYPSIKIVLDLHRDAMQRGDSIVKPVVEINGKKAAQIMIISACDDGSMGIPNWRENLRFAALFQDYMELNYRQLTRPVYFCYRKYNMDLTTGSLLLEIGSNANTLEEAVYSAQLAGEALVQLIRDNQP